MAIYSDSVERNFCRWLIELDFRRLNPLIWTWTPIMRAKSNSGGNWRAIITRIPITLFVPWRIRINGILSRVIIFTHSEEFWNWFIRRRLLIFFVEMSGWTRRLATIYKLTKLSRYLDGISNLQGTVQRISERSFQVRSILAQLEIQRR